MAADKYNGCSPDLLAEQLQRTEAQCAQALDYYFGLLAQRDQLQEALGHTGLGDAIELHKVPTELQLVEPALSLVPVSY